MGGAAQAVRVQNPSISTRARAACGRNESAAHDEIAHRNAIVPPYTSHDE